MSSSPALHTHTVESERRNSNLGVLVSPPEPWTADDATLAGDIMAADLEHDSTRAILLGPSEYQRKLGGPDRCDHDLAKVIRAKTITKCQMEERRRAGADIDVLCDRSLLAAALCAFFDWTKRVAQSRKVRGVFWWVVSGLALGTCYMTYCIACLGGER